MWYWYVLRELAQQGKRHSNYRTQLPTCGACSIYLKISMRPSAFVAVLKSLQCCSNGSIHAAV